MATVSQQLTELVKQKKQLAKNINAMGVTATEDEVMNTLVPKVLEISSSEYEHFTPESSYTPTTTDTTLATTGKVMDGDVIIVGDADLLADNIKTGVELFGVTGTYEGETYDHFTPETSYTPTTTATTLTTDGKIVDGNITIAGDTNLIASNIKSGVSIFGITGTYTGGGGSTTTIIFDADNQDSIYLVYNSTNYSLADFVALKPDFCSSENDYALNYTTSIFGWDYSCYTCSTKQLSLTSASQIAMRFLSDSTETGVIRIVPIANAPNGTADEILTACQTEGQYTEIALQWVYNTEYITTVTPLDGITAGDYYLTWVGRSNNTHPLVKFIEVME